MGIKKYNTLEVIGLVILIIGAIFMVLNDTWEDNTIPKIMDKYLFITGIGLIISIIGTLRRNKATEKQE